MSRSTLALTFAAAVALWPALAHAQENPMSSCKKSNITKLAMENPIVPGTDVHEWHLRGAVKIVCDDTTLFAEEAHWRDDEDMFYASGDVVFQQKGTHISAQKAEINGKTHQATFFDAWGDLQLSDKKMDRSLFGGQEPDARFRGEKIEKLGDHMYKLTKGTFTTCAQPTPRWEMAASSVILVPDEHAILKNMVLRVKDVPVFYVPAFYYPINKEGRSTGFLMPQYGSTTLRGFTLDNQFFWAINRSQDASFDYSYYAKTGQGFGGEYRYVESPVSQGGLNFHMIQEKPQLAADNTTVLTGPSHSYRLVGDLSQGFGSHVRLIARSNYNSSVQALQTYQQGISELTQRTRDIGGQVYGNWGRYRVSGTTKFTDTFNGTSIINAQRNGVFPSINFGIAEKSIGRSPVYFGTTADFTSFIRRTDLSDQTNDPTKNLGLRRLDVNPTIRAPLSHWPFLAVTTSASWRFTRWSQSLDGADRVDEAISRQIIDMQAGFTGPTFTRIYTMSANNGYAEKFKHVISPTFNITRTTHFEDFARVVQTDYIDQIVGGDTRIDYGLTNRLLAKRKMDDGPAVVREILTFTVSQTYHTVAAAGAFDQQYQTSQGTVPLSNFSPISFVLSARPSDGVTGNMRAEYDHQAGAMRSISTYSTVDSRQFVLTAGWSKRFVIPGVTGFEPAYASNAMNIAATIRHPEGHVGGTWSWSYDFHNARMLSQRFTGFYNSQCCGVAAEFQRVPLLNAVNGVSVDQRFNFSFSLAGLGTFANPLGSFLSR